MYGEGISPEGDVLDLPSTIASSIRAAPGSLIKAIAWDRAAKMPSSR